jgi:GNAT superfamily N-acetyltransferase
VKIETVREPDVGDLLPMLVAYCEFYDADPGEENLRALALALIERPDEGVQLIARGESGEPLGFATVYWTWQTLGAARVGVMNDLFVWPEHRGQRVGRALIEASAGLARERGARWLGWDTAPDNATAQRLYDTTGARRSEWVSYSLDL